MGGYEIVEQLRREQFTAVAEATLGVADIGPWLPAAYEAIARTIVAQGKAVAGAPFARYHQVGDGRFVVEAGFPVSTPIQPADQVRPSMLPSGPAACTIHTGPYDLMEPAYLALVDWITAHNAAPAGDPWEIYYSDPTVQPDPATWKTEVVQPYTPLPAPTGE